MKIHPGVISQCNKSRTTGVNVIYSINYAGYIVKLYRSAHINTVIILRLGWIRKGAADVVLP